MTSEDGTSDGSPAVTDGLWLGAAVPAEYSDVTYVAPMHMRSWKHCYGKFVPTEHLNEGNRYNAFDFQQGHIDLIKIAHKMWLAKSAGKLAGVALFGPDPDDRERGKIDALYVDIEWQHRGVGTHLLTKILEQLHFPVVILDCAAQNEDGCAFWESRGFVPAGKGPPYPIEGYGEVETVRYVMHRREGPGEP